jgi:hypothetical protein
VHGSAWAGLSVWTHYERDNVDDGVSGPEGWHERSAKLCVMADGRSARSIKRDHNEGGEHQGCCCSMMAIYVLHDPGAIRSSARQEDGPSLPEAMIDR